MVALIVWPVLVGGLAAGCGSSNLPDNALQVFKVKGTLTFKGVPLKGAIITFHPASPTTDSKSKGPIPTATADENGAYSLHTYLADDGAPAGEYTVTIYWPEEFKGKLPKGVPEDDKPLGPDRLKKAYSDAQTSKLKANVEKKDNTIDFTLP